MASQQMTPTGRRLGSRTGTPTGHNSTPPPLGPMQSGNVPVSHIYMAAYSGVQVLEMMCRGVAVMRRRKDSWLNATQLLKVAGVEKARRTKILLDRDFTVGEHEKVQGGYGKYQGTWIPYERGVLFTQQYGVYDVLRPLLDADPDEYSHDTATPTKLRNVAEPLSLGQASVAAPAFTPASAIGRMAPYSGGSGEGSLPEVKPASGDMPPPSAPAQQISPQQQHQQQQQLVSYPNEESFHEDSIDSLAPPSLKRQRTDTIEQPLDDDQDMGLQSTQTTVPRTTSVDSGTMATNDFFARPQVLSPISISTARNYHRSKDTMTSIWLDSSISTAVPAVFDTPEFDADIDVDIPIDDVGCTALHWASVLAKMPLVKMLISKGANPLRGNNRGETSLMRAVTVTNHLEQGTFAELLDHLYPSIPAVDQSGRTILHHIMLTAGIKGRSSASRYYLETLLEWIVRDAGNEHAAGIGLARFVEEVVNYQDRNGDTALNIAARIGNKALVQQLIEIGADAGIANRAGLRALDFGISTEVIPLSAIGSRNGSRAAPAPPPSGYNHAGVVGGSAQARLKSEQIRESMMEILRQVDQSFREEMEEKQKLINQRHTRLREATRMLADLRQALERHKARTDRLLEMQQRCQNLERAIDEEESRFSLGSSKTATTSASAAANSTTASTRGTSTSAADGGPADSDEIRAGAAAMFDGQIDADAPFILRQQDEEADEGGDEKRESIRNNGAEDVEAGGPKLAEPKESPVMLMLPPVPVLRARVEAYRQNDIMLEQLAMELEEKSSELEEKCRRVVAVCCNVEESRVDSLLEGLLQAVESDANQGDIDMARVAGFLRVVREQTV